MEEKIENQIFEKNWSWCWECDCATIDSPDGKENTCCAFWGYEVNSTWHDEILQYLRSNPEKPQSPNQDDIDNWVKRVLLPWTEEYKLISAIFGDHRLNESHYYFVKIWAEKEGLNLPTIDELSEQIGEQIHLDCKTGYEWNEIEKKLVNIIEPLGWSTGTYNTERIPRKIYIRRRRNSKCDYIRDINSLKEKEKINYTIAYEAQANQKINVLAGSCKGEVVTVVSQDFTDNMVKVKRDNTEHCNLISKKTPVIIVT